MEGMQSRVHAHAYEAKVADVWTREIADKDNNGTSPHDPTKPPSLVSSLQLSVAETVSQATSNDSASQCEESQHNYDLNLSELQSPWDGRGERLPIHTGSMPGGINISPRPLPGAQMSLGDCLRFSVPLGTRWVDTEAVTNDVANRIHGHCTPSHHLPSPRASSQHVPASGCGVGWWRADPACSFNTQRDWPHSRPRGRVSSAPHIVTYRAEFSDPTSPATSRTPVSYGYLFNDHVQKTPRGMCMDTNLFSPRTASEVPMRFNTDHLSQQSQFDHHLRSDIEPPPASLLSPRDAFALRDRSSASFPSQMWDRRLSAMPSHPGFAPSASESQLHHRSDPQSASTAAFAVRPLEATGYHFRSSSANAESKPQMTHHQQGSLVSTPRSMNPQNTMLPCRRNPNCGESMSNFFRNTAALGEVGVYTVKPGSMLAKATYSQNEEGLITATLNRKREGPEASNATGCELMSAPFAHEVFGRLGELGADDGLARAHSTKLPDFTESLSSSMDNIDEYPGLRWTRGRSILFRDNELDTSDWTHEYSFEAAAAKTSGGGVGGDGGDDCVYDDCELYAVEKDIAVQAQDTSSAERSGGGQEQAAGDHSTGQRVDVLEDIGQFLSKMDRVVAEAARFFVQPEPQRPKSSLPSRLDLGVVQSEKSELSQQAKLLPQMCEPRLQPGKGKGVEEKEHVGQVEARPRDRMVDAIPGPMSQISDLAAQSLSAFKIANLSPRGSTPGNQIREIIL